MQQALQGENTSLTNVVKRLLTMSIPEAGPERYER